MANRFLAGTGRALILKNDQLVAVANTLTDNTFSFSVTPEDVRAGRGNALFG